MYSYLYGKSINSTISYYFFFIFFICIALLTSARPTTKFILFVFTAGGDIAYEGGRSTRTDRRLHLLVYCLRCTTRTKDEKWCVVLWGTSAKTGKN